MSNSWRFLGNWFTSVEEVLPAATPRGDLTPYPFDWTLSEHAANEWQWKTARLVVEMTVEFGGETFVVSRDVSNTSVPGTTWDVLVPNDLTTATARALQASFTDSGTVGAVNFTVSGLFQIEENYVVEDTDTYTRKVYGTISVFVEIPAVASASVSIRTDSAGAFSSGTFSLLGASVSAEGTVDPDYEEVTVDITEFTGTISENYDPPADI